MALPQNGTTIEGMAGGVPGVRTFGLNTNQASNLAGFLVDTSGNATLPGTLTGSYFTVNFVGQTTEAATDRAIFVAPIACALVAVSESHGVAAGGASTLQLVKDTGTTAPGAGTDILTNNTNTGFDLNATANTPQVGTFAATTFAVGDRISLDWANAIQSSAGIVVSVILKTA